LNAAQIAVGSELPPRSFGPQTMTDVVAYQGASGDLNPMHHDDDLARSAGYPAAFSVEMLGAGYLATLCTDQFVPIPYAASPPAFGGWSTAAKPSRLTGESST
jgi:hypothetical protein